MRVRIDGLEEPHIIMQQGNPVAYAFVRFPDGERKDFPVSLMSDEGYPRDDLGRVRNITAALDRAGLDIIPSKPLEFSTFTPQEAEVLELKFEVIEKEPKNG